MLFGHLTELMGALDCSALKTKESTKHIVASPGFEHYEHMNASFIIVYTDTSATGTRRDNVRGVYGGLDAGRI